MNETLFQAAALIVPLIIAIVFHEVAHGWTARALGDPTAAEQKRLSLNPLRHVDPVGTILLPGALKLMGAPVFGWAKPVPVNAMRLRNPRRDMMLVGAAGPAMNLLMALAGAVALGLLLRDAGGALPRDGALGFVAANLVNFLLINVFLALFNLLPVPPFDGSHIVEGLLPERAALAYQRLRPLGFPIMLVLLVLIPLWWPQASVVERFVVPPVRWVTEHYFALAALVAGQG